MAHIAVAQTGCRNTQAIAKIKYRFVSLCSFFSQFKCARSKLFRSRSDGQKAPQGLVHALRYHGVPLPVQLLESNTCYCGSSQLCPCKFREFKLFPICTGIGEQGCDFLNPAQELPPLFLHPSFVFSQLLK